MFAYIVFGSRSSRMMSGALVKFEGSHFSEGATNCFLFMQERFISSFCEVIRSILIFFYVENFEYFHNILGHLSELSNSLTVSLKVPTLYALYSPVFTVSFLTS